MNRATKQELKEQEWQHLVDRIDWYLRSLDKGHLNTGQVRDLIVLAIERAGFRRSYSEELREKIVRLIANYCEESAEGAVYFRTILDSTIDPIRETALLIANQILATIEEEGYIKVQV